MGTALAKRNAFRRHPIITGFAGVCIALIIATKLAPEAEHKNLNYSEPIVTDDHAIVCPQSLLFDLRADHDANAILDAFTALSSRDEKARALGCEVLQGGISVAAHRMSAPFDTYVSVGLSGTGSDELFTMEGDLRNDDSSEGLPPRLSNPEMTAQETIAAGEAAGRSDFQARLPTLEKPMPNLRWFPQAAIQGNIPGQMDSLLVTPYGTCTYLTGNNSGYAVMTMHMNQTPNVPSIPSKLLGTFTDQAAAAKAAEKYCHEWYLAATLKPQTSMTTDHMWFTPDAEEAVGAPAEPPAEVIGPAAESSPASTATASAEVPRDGSAPLQRNAQFDEELTRCVLSSAPRNGFSSSDTGSYALHILNDSCRQKYSAWIQGCMATGDTQKTCVSTSLYLAQDELKQFAK